MQEAVIVSAVRTPTGRFLGGLKEVSATNLGALVVREAVAQYVAAPAKRPDSLESFSFIGSGRSQPGGPQPLSERHDDALAEDFGG